MKKITILLVSILVILYIFFTKLDFLLFKIKICNETNENIDVIIKNYKVNPIVDIYTKIFNLEKDTFIPEYFKEYIINIRNIKSGECTKYKHINRLYNKSLFSVEYINSNNIKIECTGRIDAFGTYKKPFGAYTYNPQQLIKRENGTCKLIMYNSERYLYFRDLK